MTKKRFVYSAKYCFHLENHVFRTLKYSELYEKLITNNIISLEEVSEPQIYPEINQDLAIVHSSEYLDDLLNLRNTNRTIYSELPLNKEIVERFILATSGTILACKLALDNQYAINLSGGFHHAFPDHAEGFCYINDVAVTCAKLINERLVSKILIVDLDLHQGNGTAVAFKNDSRVFTFSMHQDSCYPKKEMSDCDIGLADFTDDITYLTILKSALDKLFIKEKPEFIFYLAGADPYYKDQLGSLKLTFDGLMKRDNLVIEKCLLNNIPLAIVVAGGYAENPNDTVQIHYNTCLVLKECERKYL